MHVCMGHTYQHNDWSYASPAYHPIQIGFKPCHLLDARRELSNAKNPSNGNSLKETNILLLDPIYPRIQNLSNVFKWFVKKRANCTCTKYLEETTP